MPGGVSVGRAITGVVVGSVTNSVFVVVGKGGAELSTVGGRGMKGVGVIVALANAVLALIAGSLVILQAARNKQIAIKVLNRFIGSIIYTI